MKTVIYSCIAIMLLLSGTAGANETAILHGIVYEWDTFEPLDNAVVEVNSTPVQSIVAKYGVYSFELPTGDYLITASYYQDSELTHSTEETVRITGEGNYVLDLLLLPAYPEELSYPEIQVEMNNGDDNGTTGNSGLHVLGYLVLALLAITVLFHAHIYFKKFYSKKAKTPSSEERTKISAAPPMPEPVKEAPEVDGGTMADEILTDEIAGEIVTNEKVTGEVVTDELAINEISTDETVFGEDVTDEVVTGGVVTDEETTDEVVAESQSWEEETLPDDLREILDIVKSHDGRMTQKELRGRLKYSEGKVSLMLFDLEKRGFIEKFKRGRGNVIMLIDKND